MSANGWRDCSIKAAFGIVIESGSRLVDEIRRLFRGSKNLEESSSSVNRQGSINASPEFGLNSLKG
jgi:hypothetical protein